MKVKGLYLENKTFKEKIIIKLLSNIAFSYLHQLDIHAKKHLINYDSTKSPAIYALWHGYQWALGMFPQEDRKKLHILINRSNDGEMIARVCHLMGFSLIRGSHKRDGDKALRDILTETKAGNNIVFMVDGPKGPQKKVKKGIIRIAKMAQVPIIPICPYTPSKICANSWDNYQIPNNLWAKASMVIGEPILVPKDTDEVKEKELIQKLENSLFDLEKDVMIKHREYWEKK